MAASEVYATNARPSYSRNQPKWSKAILNREGHKANRPNDIRCLGGHPNPAIDGHLKTGHREKA